MTFAIESFAEILGVLSKNKLRTLLTALSVAWGMFMLAVLLGAGRGLENGAAWEFRDDAVASLWIRSGPTSVAYAGRGPGRQVSFTDEDYEALGREMPGIEHRSGRFYLWGEFQVRYGSQHAAFDIRGVHPGHRYLEKTELVRGRFLNQLDLRSRRKVAVVGSEVRKALFGDTDPLGRTIEIRGLHYLVVGEFEDVGGEAELRKIYIPISTAQLVYHSPRRIHQLMFSLTSEDLEQSRQTGEAARALLAKRHNVAPHDRRAIRVQNNLERYKKITDIFVWLRAFMWVVGIGTLLAGVVGISNIMLISVAERTKEIGIRRALGATPVSVVSMILIEAVLITSISGYTGLVLGVGAVELAASTFEDAPFLRMPSVDLGVALRAALLLVIAGGLAGLFPALRAARVNPAVALREGDGA